MASKKRGGGGGSNLGLIITLVFFVLTTVLLGVTTYLAYSENEAKDKAKKEAETKLAAKESEAKWGRTKADILQAYIGHPAAKADAGEVASQKKNIDADSSVYKNQDDYAAFRALVVNTLGKAMPWDAATQQSPSLTYERRLEDKDKDIGALRTQLANANVQIEDAKRRADVARKDADTSAEQFKKSLDKYQEEAKAQRAKDVAKIDELQKTLDRENAAKAIVSKTADDRRGEIVKLLKSRDDLQVKLDSALRDKASLSADIEEKRTELAVLKERTGVDASDLETKKLDSNALAEIRSWDIRRKDWRIAEMERTGRLPYINLGSADKVKPQLTFSIHALGRDGRLNPTPKGTLEIVAVKGPHLAQARITSLAKGSDKDPVMKGDYLFNPTWDPNARKRIVLAGLADLNQDRTDTTKLFLDLLEKQEVDVPGRIDVSDPKGLPKLVGDGVTGKVDYLVLGDTLDEVNHDRARDKEFAETYKKLIRDLRAQADASGVPTITLRKYLDMIGYRAPKLATSGRPIR